jgi:hypothetical protein
MINIIIQDPIPKPIHISKPEIEITKSEYLNKDSGIDFSGYGRITVVDEKTKKPTMIISSDREPLYDYVYTVVVLSNNKLLNTYVCQYEEDAKEQSKVFKKELIKQNIKEADIVISGPHIIEV